MATVRCIFSICLILYFFIPSHAFYSASITPPLGLQQETICNDTPFPDYCKSMQLKNKSATMYDYGRYSIQQALAATKDLLDVVNGYLTFQQPLSQTTIRALEDCQLLLGWNTDFLCVVAETVSCDTFLPSSLADDTQTNLSAIMTSHQTCLDGLQYTPSAAILQNSLLAPLSSNLKQHSVSLALFMKGWVTWVPKTQRFGRWPAEIEFPFSDVIIGPSDHLPDESPGKIQFSNITKTWPKVKEMVVVNPNGHRGHFKTINDAVAAAPNNTNAGDGYFLIYVVAGTYEEYVNIASNKKYLMIVGAGINQTIITGNRSVADGWTTFNSATFAVNGQGFLAVNITFRTTAGAIKAQAVALRNGADQSTFYRCSFEGYQDTLYAYSLRQFYRECEVYGTVDFIFGNAAVVFQNCNIYPRLPLLGQFNTITAQGRTDINQNTGTTIHNCLIAAAPGLAQSNSSSTIKTYLGRPWKQYSRTVYMQSYIDKLIDPAGWAAWSGDFALSTLYYAEYDNAGPGSMTVLRVAWPGYHLIDDTDASNFTVSNFISGDAWLPATKVPYTPGLLE